MHSAIHIPFVVGVLCRTELTTASLESGAHWLGGGAAVLGPIVCTRRTGIGPLPPGLQAQPHLLEMQAFGAAAEELLTSQVLQSSYPNSRHLYSLFYKRMVGPRGPWQVRPPPAPI